jgi:hypothetical protein
MNAGMTMSEAGVGIYGRPVAGADVRRAERDALVAMKAARRAALAVRALKGGPITRDEVLEMARINRRLAALGAVPA